MTDQPHLFHPYPVKITPLDPAGNPAGDTKSIWVKEIKTSEDRGTFTNLDDIVWSSDQLRDNITTLNFTLTAFTEDALRLLSGYKPLNRKIWKQISRRRLARQRRG